MKFRYFAFILAIFMGVLVALPTWAYSRGDRLCYEYSSGSYYCAVIRNVYNDAFQLEVIDVDCNDGWLCTGLRASRCSGHKFLSSGSSGQILTVPKSCF